MTASILQDTPNVPKGRVTAAYVPEADYNLDKLCRWVGHDLAFLPGAYPVCRKNNVVTYGAADLLASILAGERDSLPGHIGFVYGEDANPGLVDPAMRTGVYRRKHDWDIVTEEVAGATANVLIAPLATRPGLTLDGDSGLYTANAVTFAAHMGGTPEYAFPTDGGTYAAEHDSLGDLYVYHALLLNRRVDAGEVVYTPFARLALETAPFPARPAGSQLALFWTITFS
jgi:hypothetical protein